MHAMTSFSTLKMHPRLMRETFAVQQRAAHCWLKNFLDLVTMETMVDEEHVRTLVIEPLLCGPQPLTVEITEEAEEALRQQFQKHAGAIDYTLRLLAETCFADARLARRHEHLFQVLDAVLPADSPAIADRMARTMVQQCYAAVCFMEAETLRLRHQQ